METDTEQQQHKPWHAMSVEETARALGTTEDGLSDAEAAERLKLFGPNNLRQKKAKSIWRMIWEQLTDVMVIILFIAAAFSLVLYFVNPGGGEPDGLAEAIVILVVIALNATVGVVQEKKAANALEALKNMTAPTARVMREGEESVVPAAQLVPGDVVYLEDGCIVPADIRIIQDSNMKVQEAALTGESVPSEKDGPTVLPEDAPLGDRINMAYSSSVVMYGNAIGYVVGTGMNTEVGKIANLLDEQDETDTPMKRKLNSVGKTLSLVGLIVCVLVLGISLIRDYTKWVSMIMTAISLAISIIPEGLPATSTIIMALGVQRMAKKNALVKSLPAVETLGSATVVCCDKTGTLTLNKMTVTCAAVGDDFIEGSVTPVAELAGKYKEEVYADLVDGCALCVNAKKDPDNPGNILGDPTEGALVLFAEQFGIESEAFEDANPRLFEQPFDSDRKRMTVLNRTERGHDGRRPRPHPRTLLQDERRRAARSRLRRPRTRRRTRRRGGGHRGGHDLRRRGRHDRPAPQRGHQGGGDLPHGGHPRRHDHRRPQGHGDGDREAAAHFPRGQYRHFRPRAGRHDGRRA